MNRDQIKKKEERDNKYWQSKLEKDKEYAKKEEDWKKELLRLNPETPKPYIRK